MDIRTLISPLRLSLLAALLPIAAFADPIFSSDFQSADPGKLPKDFMLLSGGFTVAEEGGNKFIELPGAPLDTFGLLFGPAQQGGASASGRFFGTKQGRKFPAFGISLGGVSGYRLQVSAAKKSLEFFKGDESRLAVPFEWSSGTWLKLRIQIRKTEAGCIVEGKAWAADAAEPAAWNITLTETTPPPTGRAGVWGSPFSGSPIRYDDLAVEEAH